MTIAIESGTAGQLTDPFRRFVSRLTLGVDATTPTKFVRSTGTTSGKRRVMRNLVLEAGTVCDERSESVWTRTSDDEMDVDLSWLEAAAEERDISTFVQLYEATNWRICSAEQIVNVVRLALSIGAHGVAQNLAITGLSQHPDHAELMRMARILSPPEIRVVQGEQNSTWEKNKVWLEENRHLYQEQWVALRNGELLAAADNFGSLIKELGEARSKDILLTQVD